MAILTGNRKATAIAAVKELRFEKSVKIGDTTLTTHVIVWRSVDQSWTERDIEDRIALARQMVNDVLKAEITDMEAGEAEVEVREKLEARKTRSQTWREYGLY